jgi:hypothetical protein
VRGKRDAEGAFAGFWLLLNVSTLVEIIEIGGRIGYKNNDMRHYSIEKTILIG